MPLITFRCAVCGEPNETFVDESAGPDQEYTEDCQVCCRPNVLRIHINEDTKEVIVSAEFEE
ncbi:MAG: CPXCG motif-containing cysteine-rich protein [Bacteroidota bacterium]|nr:CPXCG motif-containing cysteine-rich protein [Bacteroidota bacterium]MDP4235840.1 CPXCG motif-containing cysteine-rich protein [Bacteroidota bacterium]